MRIKHIKICSLATILLLNGCFNIPRKLEITNMQITKEEVVFSAYGSRDLRWNILWGSIGLMKGASHHFYKLPLTQFKATSKTLRPLHFKEEAQVISELTAAVNKSLKETGQPEQVLAIGDSMSAVTGSINGVAVIANGMVFVRPIAHEAQICSFPLPANYNKEHLKISSDGEYVLIWSYDNSPTAIYKAVNQLEAQVYYQCKAVAKYILDVHQPKREDFSKLVDFCFDGKSFWTLIAEYSYVPGTIKQFVAGRLDQEGEKYYLSGNLVGYGGIMGVSPRGQTYFDCRSKKIYWMETHEYSDGFFYDMPILHQYDLITNKESKISIRLLGLPY